MVELVADCCRGDQHSQRQFTRPIFYHLWRAATGVLRWKEWLSCLCENPLKLYAGGRSCSWRLTARLWSGGVVGTGKEHGFLQLARTGG